MRLPQNDVFRPYVSNILITAMEILKNDYEENGLVASRIVFELHNNYRPYLADFVQPFWDFITNCFRMLPTNAVRNFELPLPAVAVLPISQSTYPPVPTLIPSSMSASMATLPAATQESCNKLDPSSTETAAVTKNVVVAAKVTSEQVSVSPPVGIQQHMKPDAHVSSARSASSSTVSTVSPNMAPTNRLSASSLTQVPVVSSFSQPTASTSVPFSAISPSEGPLLAGTKSAKSSHYHPKLHGAANSILLCSLKSSASFNVLKECPLIATFVIQHYTKFVHSNISTLLPLMVDALSIFPPALPVPGLSKSADHLKQQHQIHKLRTRELVACQVETLTFLTFILRAFTDQMKRYQDRMCTNVVSLLKSCPIDAVAARRDLLIALKHLLNTSFREGFYGHIDTLLDGRAISGGRFSIMHQHNNISEYYTNILSLLNYSTLADFVHHV
jgi:transformation/transcription domain-associated protein